MNILTFIKKHKFSLALIVIIVAAIIIRLLRITVADFWFDEAFTAVAIKQNWQEMFRILAIDKVHPYVYYILVKLWADLLGHNDFVIRSFSMLFGVFSIPAIFVTVIQVTKKKYLGLLGAAILAFSPFFIEYSVEARSYAMVGFVAILCAGLFWYAYETSKTKLSWKWLLWVLSAILLFQVHTLGIIFIGALVAFYVLSRVLQIKQIENNLFPLIGGITALGFITLSVLNISGFLAKLPINNLGWITNSQLTDIVRAIAGFSFGVDRQAVGLPPVLKLNFAFQPTELIFIFLIITCICLGFFIANKQKNSKNKTVSTDAILFFATMSSITLLFHVLAGVFGFYIFVERYLFAASVFSLIGLFIIIDSVHRKLLAILVITYFATLLLVQFPKPTKAYSETSERILYLPSDPIPVPRKIVVVISPIDYAVFRDYIESNANAVYVAKPPTGDYNGWAIIGNEHMLDLQTAPKGTYVISDSEMDKQTYKLFDKNEKFFTYIKR